MSAFLAFLGTYLLSLFVALLAALQLADYFAATEEFALVLMALPVFVTVSMVAFGVASAAARGPVVFNAVASCLDRKSTRLNSSHIPLSRMPSSA